jgi:hypothetical protein
MAKKMLINADMLLATPRRNEIVEPIVSKVEVAQPPIEVSPKKQNTISEKAVPTEKVALMIEPKVEQPKIEAKKIMEVSSVQKGLKTGETRATFIVKEDSLEKIKAIAYWDRQNIKDVVQTAIEEYITQYESKNGKIRPSV